MTDEELGRAEAERLGVKPSYWQSADTYHWRDSGLPGFIVFAVEEEKRYYIRSEAAYAALGRAMRKVRAACGYDESVRRLTQERDAARTERDFARMCKPDEYELLLSSERSAHEQLRNERERREKAEAESAQLERRDQFAKEVNEKNAALTAERDAIAKRQRSDEDQLCKIAVMLSKDARQSNDGTIAGLVGELLAERDAALAKCRELEEHINRASGVVQ